MKSEAFSGRRDCSAGEILVRDALDDGAIRPKKIPFPWDEVLKIIMEYITVDDQNRWVFSFHLAFLMYLSSSILLWKQSEEVQKGKHKFPVHNGLLLVLFKHA